jgi:hypothetical protein
VEFLIHAVVGASGAILDLDGVILAAEEVA